MNLLEKKIIKAKNGGRTAVIPFLTAGFPDEEQFWQNLHDLDEAGADIIEIGVPFSDPVADGPVIEEASRKALGDGITLKKLLLGMQQRQLKAGLVLMGYYNPFLQYGLEKLARDVEAAGVHGFIVPDLPYEESAPFKTVLQQRNLALIPLVGPNTSPDRMRLYAKDAQGYVYVVSVLGITGARENVAAGVSNIIQLAKNTFNVPVALGFGLKHPAQLEDLRNKPDAAVMGSALLTHLAAGKKAAEFLKPWLAKEC